MHTVKPRNLILWIALSVFAAGCQSQEFFPTPSAMPTAQISTSTPVPSPTNAETGEYTVEIQSMGLRRSFLLHLPAPYQPDQLYPLVIALHGRGSNAAEMASLPGFSDKADEANFIVIYPQGYWENNTAWMASGAGSFEDIAFIWDVIQYAISNLGANAERVFIVGFSNGAGMANRLGCALAEKLAGIATVAGSYYGGENCAPSAPLNILAFHGTADPIVPYTGDDFQPSIPAWAADWAARNGCPGEAVEFFRQGNTTAERWEACKAGVSVQLYTVEGGGHHWPGLPGVGGINATDVIWEFLNEK